jgi:hypothetical protein
VTHPSVSLIIKSHLIFHFLRQNQLKKIRINLESQLLFGFWIGWVIKNPTKPNFKNQKSWIFNVKIQKCRICWIFIGFMDWIGLFCSIQSNNPIKIQQKSNKIQHFWIFYIESRLKITFFGGVSFYRNLIFIESQKYVFFIEKNFIEEIFIENLNYRRNF